LTRKQVKPNVRVAPGRIVYTHPEHVDALHAPDAETLAANGGIATASADRQTEGAELHLSPDVLDLLVAQGVVEAI
jgi:hypothetical protein